MSVENLTKGYLHMEESILYTIKKMLGIQANYDAFDTDIITFINSALMTLQQIGVGPDGGFAIVDEYAIWSDFIPGNIMMEGVKTYIYLSVKLVFDPPGNSVVTESMKSLKDELEWRLREQAEFYPGDGSRKGYWQQVVADEEAAKEAADGE